MEVKDAMRILAAEIAETRFPMKAGTKEEFEGIVGSAKRSYRYYNTFTKEVEVDGEQVEVEFHVVGHNASHEFSIGILPDGRFVKHATGEAGWNEEEDRPDYETSIYIKDNVGYIGHW
ncbi:MAG: hypothetical protein ACWGQW_01570 [bacterium]